MSSNERATARLALDVKPEIKTMLRDMAVARSESMTQIVERLIRTENATNDHLRRVSESLKK